VRLPDGQVRRLVELYDHLSPFPDAVPALRALAGLGYELAVLSNGTAAMIGNCLDNSGLGGFFGRRISVAEVRVFKPSPVVYRHAAGRCPGRSGSSGSSPTTRSTVPGPARPGCAAWVNRSAAPFDTVGAHPDLTVPALDRLPAALAG
jgi:2-haloacid dehalogenase